MNKSKADLYKEEAAKSKNRFSTSFYYVDKDKAEKLGLTEYRDPAGDKYIRIISPDLEKFWALEVFKHDNIGANRATFLCLDKMFGKSCPICEAIKELQSRDPKDPDIKPLRASRRYLAFVYNVESRESEEKGLHFFDMPVSVKDSIMALCIDKRSGDFTEIEHPKDGKDIEYTRTGTTKENTRRKGYKLIDAEPVPDSWLEDVPSFEDILRIPTYEAVKKELLGTTSSSGEEREVSDEDTRGQGRSRGRTREEETEVPVDDTPEDTSRGRGRGETTEDTSRGRGRGETTEDTSRGRGRGEAADDKEAVKARAKARAAKLREKLNAK